MTVSSMKKGLFFSLCSLSIMLLGMTLVMCNASRSLLLSENQLAADLTRSGWSLTTAQRSRHYTPLTATLRLVGPALTRNHRPIWVGTSLSITRSLFHPFSLMLAFEGPQILQPEAIDQDDTQTEFPVQDHEAQNPVRTIRFANAHGVYWPKTNRGTAAIPELVWDNPTGPALRSVRLHTIAASFLLVPEASAGETRWAVDLHAGQAEIQAGPAMPALAASIPMPENIELRVAALQGETPLWDRATGYKRFLIQALSFEMEGLVCSVKGNIDPDGTGDLSAHIVGLKTFARNWLIRLPDALRERPDYAPFLQKLNDEMARIPDQIDLPIPLAHNDISLQNHIFAIISGHPL